MVSAQPTAFQVEAAACIRCAACVTVAPAHFAIKAGPARAVRAAKDERERALCAAAAAICPTRAISEVPAAAVAEPPPLPPEPRELFPSVLDTAEAVRWRLADLPWGSFDKVKATPGLMAVVREMAYSEQTTFSATQRFMEAFAANIDFSQWISVWFYEETRHPLALLKWLALAGETPEGDFATEGRVSAPFMSSLIGTLVTNVISELVAADAYVGMVGGKPEPLITEVVKR